MMLIMKACQAIVEKNGGPYRFVESWEQEKELRTLRRMKYCMNSVLAI
jgi:hypothetical protein